jgi:hypothetical protein
MRKDWGCRCLLVAVPGMLTRLQRVTMVVVRSREELPPSLSSAIPRRLPEMRHMCVEVHAPCGT